MQIKYCKKYCQSHLHQPSWSEQPYGEVTAPVKVRREAVWLFWESYSPCIAQCSSPQQVTPAADSQPGWLTSDTWRHHCSRLPTPLLHQGREWLNRRRNRFCASQIYSTGFISHTAKCRDSATAPHGMHFPAKIAPTPGRTGGSNHFDWPSSSYPCLWGQQLMNANSTGSRTCKLALGLRLYTQVLCGICPLRVKPSRRSNHIWQYKGAHGYGCRLSV